MCWNWQGSVIGIEPQFINTLDFWEHKNWSGLSSAPHHHFYIILLKSFTHIQRIIQSISFLVICKAKNIKAFIFGGNNQHSRIFIVNPRSCYSFTFISIPCSLVLVYNKYQFISLASHFPMNTDVSSSVSSMLPPQAQRKRHNTSAKSKEITLFIFVPSFCKIK